MPKLSFILTIFLSISSGYLVKGLSIYNPSTTKAPNSLFAFIDPADSMGYACPSLNEGECRDLPDELCFDQPFLYSSTSVKAYNASLTLYNEVLKHLDILKVEMSCWYFLKPLLCVASRPKCDNGIVYLPSKELCQKAKKTCSRTLNNFNDWNCEKFSQCKKQKYMLKIRSPPKIKSDLHTVDPWNKRECLPPLVRTVIREHWVPDIVGCGLQCKNSFYSEDNHAEAYIFNIVMAVVILVAALFSTGTSLLIPKFRNYPERPIVSIFIDLIMISVGWLIQIFPDAHKSITCLSDGTLRMTHPSLTDFTCILTFVLTYAFGVQAVVRFVELSYAYYAWSKSRPFPLVLNWEITFFEYAAWTIPFLLTFVAFILKQVSGDPMSGICSVGLYDTSARLMFVVLPVSIAYLVAAGFFLYAFYAVIVAMANTVSVEEKNATRVSAFKIYVGLALAIFAVARLLSVEGYYYFNQKKWIPTLKDDIYMKEDNALSFSMESKPDVLFVKIQFITYFFGTLLVMMLLAGESIYNPWKDFSKSFCEKCKNMYTSLLRRCGLYKSSLNAPMHAVNFQGIPSSSTANESNSIISSSGYQPDQESLAIMDHRIDCWGLSYLKQNGVVNSNHKNLKTRRERNELIESRIVPTVHSSDSGSVL